MSRNSLRRRLYRGLTLCLTFASFAVTGPQAMAQAQPGGAMLQAGTSEVKALPAKAPQVWFHMGGDQGPEAHRSWDTLFFAENAAWPAFMNHVQVVELLTQHLWLLSDAELAKVAARLKEHHIALAVARGPCVDGMALMETVLGWSHREGRTKIWPG